MDDLPEHAAYARTAFYLLATSVHRRAVTLRDRAIFKVLSVADHRIDLVVRMRTVASLMTRRRLCCVGKLVFKLLSKLPHADDIFCGASQTMLRGIAYAISYALSVADTERRHKRNKNVIAKPISSFVHFCSKAFLE